MAWTEVPALAKAAGNSYSPRPTATAPVVDSTDSFPVNRSPMRSPAGTSRDAYERAGAGLPEGVRTKSRQPWTRDQAYLPPVSALLIHHPPWWIGSEAVPGSRHGAGRDGRFGHHEEEDSGPDIRKPRKANENYSIVHTHLTNDQIPFDCRWNNSARRKSSAG